MTNRCCDGAHEIGDGDGDGEEDGPIDGPVDDSIPTLLSYSVSALSSGAH